MNQKNRNVAVWTSLNWFRRYVLMYCMRWKEGGCMKYFSVSRIFQW